MLYLGGPGHTKITKRREKTSAQKTTIFWVPKNASRVSSRPPKWTWEASAEHAKVGSGTDANFESVARFQGVPPKTQKVRKCIEF